MRKFSILIGLVMLVSACLSSSNPVITDSNNQNTDNRPAILGKMLEFDEVIYREIVFSDNNVLVYYETSFADQYDDEIIANWAAIFGSASEFDVKEIVIINEINGMDIAEIRSTKENVDNLFNGIIDESEFWENVNIKSR